MASIKVSVRCRPFAHSDRLGCFLQQNGEEEGEVELLNCDYSTKRFPFTYCWFSGFGYKRRCDPKDLQTCSSMALINQVQVYDSCGKKIKEDLMGGNAVVIFAYGLSGSGKTFTVFGPDAVDAPEAWFKHATPTDMWGLFPRLAYELFEVDRKDGWKLSMKYFQNVVDIVRDLMSPTCEEQHYKNGMRKDKEGFMDIEWCVQVQITSWNDLRKRFLVANGRKAIAPTQFNPMSTRGHCILVLEVETPHPDLEGMRQKGRLYVCDLAGTEPAGDIVCAVYDKVPYEDGTFEYQFKGPHADPVKTKELQAQGKKINLSLSEMAQFFMKMAEAVMKKKIKPGVSLPGCNSFFLCKYLKDTMLQARTYLCSAIRPEVQFLRYTFATLGFAKNASCVKLAPKKAGSAAATPAERKLMVELVAMKALVEQLKAASGPATDDSQTAIIADLQAKLAAKQGDLATEMDGGGESAQNERMEMQRKEYGKRGIHLAHSESDKTDRPYFLNADADAFRSARFMYILEKDVTVFGAKCDIAPPSNSVLKDHCSVRFDGTNVFITAGKGDTWVNGVPLDEGKETQMKIFDRLAMGDELCILHWKGHDEDGGDCMTAEEAVEEFQEGLANRRTSGGGVNAAETARLVEERARIMKERESWEEEKRTSAFERDEEEYARGMSAVDNRILDLLPKTREAKEIVDLMGRVTMSFDVVLEQGTDNIPAVYISVENTSPKYSILFDPHAFLPKLSLLKDEMMKLRSALDDGREYTLPERHDPLYLMFDNDYHLGNCISWPEFLAFNLATEGDETMQDIKNAAVPYNTVGLLEVVWVPLAGPEEEDQGKPVADVDEMEELIGKPWCFRLEIKKAQDLPVFCEMAYIEYTFFGEIFHSEVAEHTTYSPCFDYSYIHYVPSVTEEFLKFLKGSMVINIHVTQHVYTPQDRVGTQNEIVSESIRTGVAKGYEITDVIKPKTESEVRCEKLAEQLLLLKEENLSLREENVDLRAHVDELEAKVETFKVGDSKTKFVIEAARMTDAIVNGDDVDAETLVETEVDKS